MLGGSVVNLVNAIAPLYLCIALGYGSSKLRLLPHEQTYAGIGGFASKFSLPFLVFRMIGSNDPYHMDLKLIAADTVYKVAVLFVLSLYCFYRPTHQSVAWVSTLFNLATMPNSVLIGTPLLTSLYPGTAKDVTALVFMQLLLWFSVCMLILEIYKAVYENSQEFEEKVNAAADHQQGVSSSARDHLQQGERQYSKQPPEVVADGLVIHIPQDSVPEFDKIGVVKVRPTKRQVAKRIVQTVVLKFIAAPIVWAGLLGYTYSLLNFKFNQGKAFPAVLKSFIDLMADYTLGICMFMIGMNMGVAKKLFDCGIPKALLGAGVRFIVAPACMAVVSFAVGLRGNMFRFAVMQAMVPQAILSFVYANHYNVHIDIFSTAVWSQTLIFIPFAIGLEILLRV
ncbi:unnamed protein product [Calypogeia fissa]